MKLLVEFEVREFTDMYYTKEVLVFEGSTLRDIIDKAMDWTATMNSTSSGDTITFKHVMPPTEAIEYLSKEIANVLEHPVFPKTNGDLDEVDVKRLKQLSDLLQTMIAQGKHLLKNHEYLKSNTLKNTNK